MLSEYSTLINSLIIVYVLLVLSSLYVRGVVFLEWVVSFIHYIIPFNIVLSLIFWFTSPDLFLSSVILFGCTLPLLIRYANFTLVKFQPGKGEEHLTILFLNKLFSNRNYAELDEKIKQINPDIIGIVELLDGEIEKIPALSDYKHRFYKPSRPNAALGLLSKYPFSTNNLNSLPHAIVSTMKLKGENYQVIVFHPSPPTLPGSLASRDKDLKNLNEYLEKQDDPIILMGDFNVTPWSPSYISYLSKLKHLKNVAKGSGMHTTLRKGPLEVFIDFIFIPKKSGIQSFNTRYMQGSDHKLITSSIIL